MTQHANEANKIQKREEDEKRRRNASKVNCKSNLDCPCIRRGSELVRNADLFQSLRCAGHFWSQEGIFEWVQKQVEEEERVQI
jgi:hypothetical protein